MVTRATIFYLFLVGSAVFSQSLVAQSHFIDKADSLHWLEDLYKNGDLKYVRPGVMDSLLRLRLAIQHRESGHAHGTSSKGKSAPSPSGDFVIRLSSPKSVYSKGEYVYAFVRVENQVDRVIRMQSFSQLSGVQILKAWNENKVPVAYRGGIVDARPDTLELASRSSWTEPFDLSVFHTDTSSRWWLFAPGKYTFVASIAGVRSNELQIEIRDYPSKEKAVFEEIVSAVSSLTGRQAVDSALKLIRRHPHSVLLPNLYYSLISNTARLNQTDPERKLLRERALRFLEKYPDHPESYVILWYYVRAILEDVGTPDIYDPAASRRVNRTLRSLQRRHQTSLLSGYVDIVIAIREHRRHRRHLMH